MTGTENLFFTITHELQFTYLIVNELKCILKSENIELHYRKLTYQLLPLKNIELQMTRNQSIFLQMTLNLGSEYFYLPNKCGGTNKRGG